MSNARFSILQARAVKDKRISDSQFRTLAALGMYADNEGWCFPMLSTLGTDLSKSKQAVGRDTIALRKLGYLEVQARYDKHGSRRSSMYRLKYDLPPVNVDDSTPSTPEVDTPSTPEVDVNDPSNDPKKQFSFTKEEQEQNDAKVKYIIENSRPDMWKGRELIRDNLLPLADWYNKATGQVMTKRVQKSWWKALQEWQDEGLTAEHLQTAFEAQSKWRMVSDPNMLTKDACAIKAANAIKPEPEQRTTSTGYFA